MHKTHSSWCYTRVYIQSLRHTWPVASATTADDVDCIISTDQDVSNGLAVSAGTSHGGR